MKKTLFLLFIFFISFADMYSQNELCRFTTSVRVRHSVCHADGVVTVSLQDTAGKNLENFRYSIIPGVSLSTTNILTGISAGVYTVVTEALCYTGTPGAGNYIVVTDTIKDVVVESDYITPTAGVIQGDFSSSHLYGNVSSFDCTNTGIIQLKIENGSFPYMVEISKDGHYLRTDTFHMRMYDGMSPTVYNYRDYYTIGRLGEGNYTFRIKDGCAYQLPGIQSSVTSISEPYATNSMYIYRGAAHATDSNVLRFSLLYNMEYNLPYYYAYSHMNGLEQWWEYAVSIDGQPFSTWEPVTPSGVVYDTLSSFRNFCEIYGKAVTVKVRVKECPDREYSRTFSIQSPRNLYSYSEYLYGEDSTVRIPAVFDTCFYTSDRFLYYQNKESMRFHKSYNYAANVSSSSADFYYTAPLTVVVKNLATDSVIRTSTSQYLTWNEYLYNLRNLDGMTVNITVTDKNGCEVANNSVVVSAAPRETSSGGSIYRYNWSGNYSGGNYCGTSTRSVYIYRNNTIPGNPDYYFDSTIVRLVESPNGNLYNFTALYLRDENRWVVEKENPANTTNTYGSGVYVYMNATDLPSGNYKFEITDKCNTYMYTQQADFPLFLTVSEEPRYDFRQECSYMEMTPLAGQIQLGNTNVSTYFKVLNGPPGGYPTGNFLIGDPVRLTLRGHYTVQMFPSQGESNSCVVRDTTFYYSGGTVEIDYLHAYVCSAGELSAKVKVKGKNGSRPYRYTIYDGPNGQGTILASDTIGDFSSIAASLDDEISVFIEDSCGASFITNITITNLEVAKKAWFGDNTQESEECQGNDVYLYGISLGNVTYQWRGPNGYSSTSQTAELRVNRDLMASGTYYLDIFGANCPNVNDSLSLNILISPSVIVEQDAEICPGDAYQIHLTPNGTGRISYTVGQQENSVVKTTVFQNKRSGQTDTLTVRPLSDMIVWIVQVEDSICSYNIPEDTIFIRVKPVSTGCDVTVSGPVVCYDSTAVLTAVSSLAYPYVLNWYADENLTTLVLSDTLTHAADEPSVLALQHLIRDTLFYVLGKNSTYCESRPGYVNGEIWMNNGTTYLNCGEAMRFYDSGGPAGNYRNNENYIHTFVSPGRPVSIQFQSFHTENFSYDKMYIYDGGSINAPLLGSELGGDLDGNLPGPYVSTGDSLTILFISNASTAYSGWEAVVGVDYAPVTVKAEVLDSITVSLSSASPLPLHYNGSTVLTAAPAGGRGAQYAYQWYTGSDGINWVLTSETSSAFAVNNLTVPTYYRVSVQDISPDACGGIAYSTIFLNVADIHLSLELSVAKRDICTGDFPLYVTIRNQGDEPATGVVATLNLPYNIILRDTISGMDFGTVPPQDSVTRTVNLYTWSGKDPMPCPYQGANRICRPGRPGFRHCIRRLGLDRISAATG